MTHQNEYAKIIKVIHRKAEKKIKQEKTEKKKKRDLSPSRSIITLNVNVLNIQIQITDWHNRLKNMTQL